MNTELWIVLILCIVVPVYVISSGVIHGLLRRQGKMDRFDIDLVSAFWPVFLPYIIARKAAMMISNRIVSNNKGKQ